MRFDLALKVAKRLADPAKLIPGLLARREHLVIRGPQVRPLRGEGRHAFIVKHAEHEEFVAERGKVIPKTVDTRGGHAVEAVKPGPQSGKSSVHLPHRPENSIEVPPSGVQPSDEPGRRRAFVLVVEVNITDTDLESFVCDVLDRHRDAPMLDVQVYDSKTAAIQPRALDGGKLAFEHLVASIRINSAIPSEIIRIRGKRTEHCG